MPTASRNERRKRRLKRNNSLLQRSLKQESVERGKAMVVLLALLGQAGGEVTISKGTMQQTLSALKELTYQVTPTTEGEFIIRLVSLTETPEETASTQAVQMATVNNPVEVPNDEPDDVHVEATAGDETPSLVG